MTSGIQPFDNFDNLSQQDSVTPFKEIFHDYTSDISLSPLPESEEEDTPKVCKPNINKSKLISNEDYTPMPAAKSPNGKKEKSAKTAKKESKSESKKSTKEEKKKSAKESKKDRSKKDPKSTKVVKKKETSIITPEVANIAASAIEAVTTEEKKPTGKTSLTKQELEPILNLICKSYFSLD